MIVAWLAFPLVLAVLCAGAGLAVERAGGHRIPGPLVPALGFCALVCLTQLAVLTGTTAPLATPAAVVVALAGLWLGRARLREARHDHWAIALFVVTLLGFAAPSLLTGGVTFLGYTDLGDASIHFELVDRLMHHGASIAGLEPSSYAQSVNTYFLTRYPTGAHTVLGVGRALTGADVAWLFQPYLAVLAALAALGVLTFTRTLTRVRWLSALTAGLVVAGGLVYTYASQQQAIKEVATVVTLVTVTALLPSLLAARPGPRAALPTVVASGAALGVLNVAAAPWLGPVLLIGVVGLVRRHRSRLRAVGLEVATFVVVGLVLAIPALRSLNTFVDSSNITLTAVQELGNLQRPLQWWQAFGVWPAPDFRFDIPSGRYLGVALFGVAVFLAVCGVFALARRRSLPVIAFVAISVVGFVVVAGRASPWAYGKALMILTPALVLLAVAGAIGLWEARGRRPEAVLALVALVAGIAWTDAETYRNVSPAPTDRFRELARVGERFGGEGGRSTYFEFEEFAKHFLRQTNPTGAMEAFRPDVPTGAGGARFGFSSDPDQWDARSLQDTQRLLITRRGPAISRPPTGFERVFGGRFYDVWRRVPSPGVLAHLSLQSRTDGGAVPACADVRRIADVARQAGGRLAWVPRAPTTALRVGTLRLPANWTVDGSDPEILRPVGPGRLRGAVSLPRAGTYTVWFEGSETRPTTVAVDGRVVGTVRDALNPRLSSVRVARVALPAGRHVVTVTRGGGSFAPGNGARQRFVGPVSFTLAADPGAGAIRTGAAADWRQLCGQQLDWVEAISG